MKNIYQVRNLKDKRIFRQKVSYVLRLVKLICNTMDVTGLTAVNFANVGETVLYTSNEASSLSALCTATLEVLIKLGFDAPHLLSLLREFTAKHTVHDVLLYRPCILSAESSVS